MSTAHGVHDYVDDPRNAEILINVNGALVPRNQAVVSVFDAGFVLGDGVWEGLRVAGRPPGVPRSAPGPALGGRRRDRVGYRTDPRGADRQLYRTLAANGMTGDGVHVRLMVTRGPKSTPYQDPRMSAGPATVVIIAEHKDPLPATTDRGLSLFTVHVRRRPGHAGSEAQCAQQAERHHRLHPGLHRRRRRGIDARSARLRRHLQLDPLLPRAQGRGLDVHRRLLPGRHHPVQRAPLCEGQAFRRASATSASPRSTAPTRRS